MLWETVQAIGTSWPPWLALAAIFFCVLFRSEIAGLIRRITGIGRGGVTAVPQEPQSHAASDPRTAADELLAQLDSQYVRAREEAIKKELQTRGLSESSPETVRVLTRFATSALVSLEFEQIEGTIWGSQIAILTYLNSRRDASTDELRVFYDAVDSQYPQCFSAYSFDQYMGYLIGHELVLREGDRFSITVKGRTYLMYRVHQGKGSRLF